MAMAIGTGRTTVLTGVVVRLGLARIGYLNDVRGGWSAGMRRHRRQDKGQRQQHHTEDAQPRHATNQVQHHQGRYHRKGRRTTTS